MKANINATFNVDKCHFPKNNGEHTVNLDLTGLTEDDFEQYALRSIVIGLQATLRGKGKVAEEFDSSKPYKVGKPGTRIATGGTVGKVTKLLNALTEEQKMAIATAMGFSYIPARLAQPDEELEAGEQ